MQIFKKRIFHSFRTKPKEKEKKLRQKKRNAGT